MGTVNLAGRKPQVISPMGNGIVWLTVALAVLFVGVVIIGFHTRIKKKQQTTQITTSETIAHDAAPSNRTAVRNRAEATSLNSVSGGTAPGDLPPNGGPLRSAATALVGAVKTDAHPFPQSSVPTASQPIAVPTSQPYYYAPQPQSQTTNVIEDADRQAVIRARERREQAINAQTGIATNSNTTVLSAARSIDPIQADLDRIAQLSTTANNATRPILAGTFPTLPMTTNETEGDQNRQDDKRKFQQADEGDYLRTTRVAPISPWVVERGDKIVAILPAKVVSDLPGDLTAEVKSDVYDSPSHRFVLIPAGSLLAGAYNSSVSYGQGRVQVIWTYLRFPDGSFINLDKFVSHAADGAVGLSDQTDNHIKRLVGGVLLSSIFAAGIQISQNHNGTNSTLAYPSTSQIAGSAVGQQAGQVGEQITSRNLNVQPTLKIRVGEPFYISVQKSMIFPGPYEAIKIGSRP